MAKLLGVTPKAHKHFIWIFFVTFDRRPVASLWIGDTLHYLNQLCLKSHLHHGHPVILYCTDDVKNVPIGVEVRPASDIMDISSQRVRETSASFWSNVFRYKMIQKTGAIWIDCDAFCFRPFPEDCEWIFGVHGLRGALNCGVVAIPQAGPLMDMLLDYYDNPPDYAPWWGKKQREKMDSLPKDLPQTTRIYRAERTAFGPQAFTYFTKKAGVFDQALGVDALYPVPFQLNDVFYDPHSRPEGWFTQNTLSVHLYTNGIKPYWANNPPLPNSFAARMCQKIGIDPVASMAGEPSDIEPATPVESPVPPQPTAGASVSAQNATLRIEALEQELKKKGRQAKRKAQNSWADGFLEGVCGILRPGDLALDLGANAGDVSERLLKTGADVIAFDPEPWAVDKIKARLGDHPNYTFHHAAVGITDGTVRMYRAANFANNEKNASVKSTIISGGRMIDESEGQGIDVPVINFVAFIKTIIEERGQIAFLKMDIEGAELDILQAMDEANLFQNIRCTVVETHEREFRDLRPRFKQLREHFEGKYRPEHVNLNWK